MRAAIEAGGNASSIHTEGRVARNRIERAREQVATLANAPTSGVVFTSGGTEANCLAIMGVIKAEAVERLLVSSIEHPSVLEVCRASGIPVREIAVTSQGVVDMDDLAQALSGGSGRALVSVMLANNETGALQPVKDIAPLAHEHDALLHTDAVQAAGKIEIDFAGLGIDLMTLSSHKIGGPQGAGALIVREGLKLQAQILGGGQELRRRAGTENVPAISGFGEAAVHAGVAAAKRGYMSDLTSRMEKAIVERLDDVTVFSDATDRLPNTSCLAVPGSEAEYLLIALDLQGFAISSGSACSSGKVARSHVLSAMGVADQLSDCAVRISLGWNTTQDEVERFADAFVRCCERKKSSATEVAA